MLPDQEQVFDLLELLRRFLQIVGIFPLVGFAFLVRQRSAAEPLTFLGRDEPVALAEMKACLGGVGTLGVLLEGAEVALLGRGELAQLLLDPALPLKGDRRQCELGLFDQSRIRRRRRPQRRAILLESLFGLLELVFDQIEHGDLVPGR